MSMTVQVQVLNAGSSGSPNVGGVVSGSSFSWCRDDSVNGTTATPTPASTGTNFSWVKSIQAYIVLHNSLSMTNLTVGRTSSYSQTGTIIWYVTTHNQSAYVVASTPPSPTSDDNITAPSINSSTGELMPLIGSASPYATGPISTDTTYVNPMVEACLGVDATCTASGSSLAIATLRWVWTEG